jgi:hypothetical protein
VLEALKLILEGLYMKLWIFKNTNNGETVMVGNSYREGIMDVYKVDKKHGIVTRRDSTWAEIDSWQMLYITTIRTFRRPSIEMFEYFK